MFTATLRGMLAHKLRLVLTTASIALGVAFLAGTLDPHRHDEHWRSTSSSARSPSGTDAVVRHEAAYTASSGVGVSRAVPSPPAVLDQVQQGDGVAPPRASSAATR